MARRLSEFDTAARHRAFRDAGFCVFDEVFGAAERRAMLDSLHGFIDGLAPERLAGFGATIFALAAREPELGRVFRETCVLPFVEQAMQGPLDLRRTGARISGLTSHERIIWHHHHGWAEQDLARRTAFERVHFICYLNGTDRAHGPLILKPRAFSDPFLAAPDDVFGPLPDEVAVEVPPGSIVVMDAPILHSAWRGTGSELRTIWGVHVQSRAVTRPHLEDDPPVERLRVRVRHQAFRWGLRDGKRWLEEANRSPLKPTHGY